MIVIGVTFLPALALCAAGAIVLIAGHAIRRPQLWNGVTLLAILLAGGAVYAVAAHDGSTAPADGSFSRAVVEAQRQWGRFGAAATAGLLFVGGLLCLANGKPPEENPLGVESHGLFLLGLAGALVIGITDDAVVLLIGLEVCGMASVGLIVTSTSGPRAKPLARRAFALQATSTTLLILGVAFLYATSESTSLSESREALLAAVGNADGGRWLAGKAALVFLMAGLAVRLLFLPLHFGSPGLVSQSSLWSAGYSLVLVRAAALIALFRLTMQTMVGFETAAMVVAVVLSGGTMLVGTALALNRSRLRETITYLVIGHGGVVLFGMAAAWGRTSSGISALTALMRGEAAAALSAIVGLMSATGILAVLRYLRRQDRPLTYLDELRGLFRSRPLAASAMAILLLNLVGVPPLPGFWARLWMLLSALSIARETADSALAPHPAFVGLAVILGIQILLSAAVAWRIIAVMLFDPPVGKAPAEGGRGALCSALLCALVTLVIGFSPTKTVGWLDAVVPRPENRPASSSEAEGRSLATALPKAIPFSLVDRDSPADNNDRELAAVVVPQQVEHNRAVQSGAIGFDWVGRGCGGVPWLISRPRKKLITTQLPNRNLLWLRKP